MITNPLSLVTDITILVDYLVYYINYSFKPSLASPKIFLNITQKEMLEVIIKTAEPSLVEMMDNNANDELNDFFIKLNLFNDPNIEYLLFIKHKSSIYSKKIVYSKKEYKIYKYELLNPEFSDFCVFEINFKVNDSKAMDSMNMLLSNLSKLHVLNLHISFNITINSNIVLELSNQTLGLPNLSDIYEYFEKQFLITKMNMFYFSKEYKDYPILVDGIFIFNDALINNENLIEFTFFNNKRLNQFNIMFNEVFISTFSNKRLTVMLKNVGVKFTTDNSNNLIIKNINKLSINILINISNFKLESDILTSDFIDFVGSFMETSFKAIKSQNIFIVKNVEENKIINQNFRDFNLISQSIVEITNLTVGVNPLKLLLNDLTIDDLSSPNSEEEMLVKLNNSLYKNSYCT